MTTLRHKSPLSPEGTREYVYDKAGRLLSETLNGEFDVSYKYGYLDKVVEVNRKGKITKYTYDGNGMLAMKTFDDGSTEVWVWDGLALIRRGDDIYVNEPHVSGGLPIISRTKHGIRYHEHDFLGTTLFSFDMKGNIVADYSDTTIYGEGSIQHDRSARFTGKPYDEDMQAYIFPYRNYDATTMRWRSADPAGYPDGINNHFYACVPTMSIDPWGLEVTYDYTTNPGYCIASGSYTITTTWTENSIFTWGASFTVSFPLGISVTISSGFGWENTDGSYSKTTTGEQPEIEAAPSGYKWQDSNFAITAEERTKTEYDRGTHLEPIYGPTIGLQIIIGYAEVDNDYQIGSFSITYNWSRIALEL